MVKGIYFPGQILIYYRLKRHFYQKYFIVITFILDYLHVIWLIELEHRVIRSKNGMIRYGIKSKKIKVIAAGVETDQFLPSNESEECEPNIMVGFIGRLTEIKGVSIIIRNRSKISQRIA